MRSIIAVIVAIVLGFSASAAAGQSSITCDSYDFQEAAQFILSDANADALDPDGDGVACEELPSRGDQPRSAPERPTTQREPANDPAPNDEPTAQEEAYFAALADDSETFGSAIGDVGQLFSEAGVDPTLLFDTGWITDVAVQFAILQQIGIDAQSLDPSPRQAHIHDLWLETNRLTGLAIDDITRGVDNLDPDAINTGAARISYASNLVDDTTAAIVAFFADPNTPIEPTYVIGPVSGCEPFASYALAQDYYGAHPEEQATIDPNLDGRACEVYFGQ